MAHAPVVDGKERYVFWVAPHTALSGDNVHGKVWRPGRAKASTACGALLAVLVHSDPLQRAAPPRQVAGQVRRLEGVGRVVQILRALQRQLRRGVLGRLERCADPSRSADSNAGECDRPFRR